MSTRPTILIADDHPLFRKGLREVIASDPTLELIAEVADGSAALDAMRIRRPALAVLDIDMPKMTGLEVARAAAREVPDVGIIIMTMHRDGDLFDEAMDAGARGYVLKDSAVAEILEALRMVERGGYYISPALSGHLVDRRIRTGISARRGPALEDLTPGERRVLALVAANRTSREIAESLGISVKTVENHRTSISAKLGLRGSHSLLKFALENREKLSGA